MKNTSQPIKLPDDLIDVAEAAALLKVESKTIYRWSDSWLPCYRISARCLRLSKRELLAAIATRRNAGVGEQ